MVFSVHHNPEHNYIVGSFIGGLNLKALKTYADEVVRVATKYNCKRFLNDLRAAETHLCTVEFYDALRILSESGIGQSWKRAIVVLNNLEDFEFFETVAANRGFMVKVFVNPDDAMNWLKGHY